VTLRGAASITHRTFYKRRPVNNAVIARFTYSKGTTEADVKVDIQNSCVLAFDEPMPGKKPWGVINTLEVFEHDLVGRLLAIYAAFLPDFK
jgi:hypothetical protein